MMRVFGAIGVVSFAGVLVSCVPRQYNESDAKSSQEDSGAVQVNALAHNAVQIWQGNQTTEALQLPEGYDIATGSIKADSVFYVIYQDFWNEASFIAAPTNGVKVDRDVLIYPANQGKTLKLKFSAIAAERMTQAAALRYCESQKMRLPSAREVFDFCAAGVKEPNYGPNHIPDVYPKTARCGGQQLWSASLSSDYRSAAWHFSGTSGRSAVMHRSAPSGVRCVGGI